MPDFTPSNPGAMFPAYKLTAVTPSNSTELVGVRALYVGTTGNVAIVACNDTAAVTLTAVPAGTVLPIFVSKVMSTGTTASNIVAFY